MEKPISLIAILETLLLIIILNAANAGEQRGYIFTCPRRLRTGYLNGMNLRRFGELNSGTVKVQIHYKQPSDGKEVLVVENEYDLPEGEAGTNIDLFIEKFEKYVSSGTITIRGSFGNYTMYGVDKVSFMTVKDRIVIIQTDKPIYKKGQTVLFRIVKVNRDLKPSRDGEEADIWVEDNKNTRLFQWKNVSIANGIKQLEFPLSDEPVLGKWKICTSVDKDNTCTNFEVQEYVLPKFEVTINVPAFVLSTDEEIPITVCAKYTYGKTVKGILNLNASYEIYGRGYGKFPVLEITEKLDGCVDYTINVSQISPEYTYYSTRRVQIVASVEEEGTGIIRNETKLIHRQTLPVSLSLNEDQKKYFKPGLPFNGKLRVSNPDSTPISGEPTQICYTVSRERVLQKWQATRKVKFCKNYTSDNYGIIEYTVPPQNTDSISISIEAISLGNWKNKTHQYHGNSYTPLKTSVTILPWFSKSGNFLQLQPVQYSLKCGSKTSIPVLFTSKTSGVYKIYYQISKQTQVLKNEVIEHAFSVNDDVSSEFQNENKLIDGKEIQISPPLENSAETSANEDCPSAREARYVPPVGKATVEINVDSSLSPEIYILVYYVREDGEIVADSAKFKVEKCFENEVTFKFGEEMKQPGTKTTLNLKASPNSLCGIKVVDKSVSLLDNSDQLTKEKVFSMLNRMDPGIYYGKDRCGDVIRQPGLFNEMSKRIAAPFYGGSFSQYKDSMEAWDISGFIAISDLTLFSRPCKPRNNPTYDDDYADGMRARKRGSVMLMSGMAIRPTMVRLQTDEGSAEIQVTKSVVEIRNYFPETWLFKMEFTNSDGEFVTKETLPHTITEWVGSAVCINQQDGLGISDSTSIKGFQAFFISFTLPYSVIRGETFEMVVSIFNYASDSSPVTVTLVNTESFKPIDGYKTKDLCIAPGTSGFLRIKLKAAKLGTSNITVHAQTAKTSDVCGSDRVSDVIAKDAMTYPLIVEAEGFPVEIVNSALFCVGDSKSMKKSIQLELPEDLVKESQRAYIDVTGNILGPSLDNLEQLVRLPTGCGEQNMVKFVPNVLVYDLLLKTKALTSELKERLIKNMNTGAQRQLTYRHGDGSYSAFGTKDKEGSMFLTAFVLRYFKLAENFITIDNNTIAQMQKWIISKQDPDGCFPNVGKIVDQGLQGGIDKETSKAAITAYVLASLEISGYGDRIVKDAALSCINRDVDAVFNPYVAFLYAYSEALSGNSEAANKRIESIKPRANETGGVIYYPNVNSSKSKDVETAAYAILAILESGGSAEDVLPIVQYLSRNMNPNGGFSSTQDTCLGLQALVEFVKRTFKDPINIILKISGGLEKQISVTEDDKLMVKRNKIFQVPSELQLEGTGTGCALYQTVLRYNTYKPPGGKAFDFKVSGECVDNECKRGRIKVDVSYVSVGKRTGMALVEVKMVSGMTPVKDSIDKLKEDQNLKLMRSDFENNVMVFYFNEISNDRKNFSFEVEKVIEVPDRLPAIAKVYDYYNTERRTETLYSLGG